MNSPVPQKSSKAVAYWILTGVFMLVIQVILGGITRLTGSGLSITEWNVVTGTLPPFNQQQWLAEFSKYKQTSQFLLLNSDFNLSDFKFIFLGMAPSILGKAYRYCFYYRVCLFHFQEEIKKGMLGPLLALFLLGALQGTIGWIMVISGLTGDELYVKPTKLALHFVFALVLIAYAFWFALRLLVPAEFAMENRNLRTWTLWIIGLLFIQLIFGALMAGHKAAPVAATWPDINGSFFPPISSNKSTFLPLLENKLLIHFIHRNLAYFLFILITIFTLKALQIKKGSRIFLTVSQLPLLIVIIQLVLGILTVLNGRTIVPDVWGNFEWLALLHQVVGMLLVLSMVAIHYLVCKKSVIPVL